MTTSYRRAGSHGNDDASLPISVKDKPKLMAKNQGAQHPLKASISLSEVKKKQKRFSLNRLKVGGSVAAA